MKELCSRVSCDELEDLCSRVSLFPAEEQGLGCDFFFPPPLFFCLYPGKQMSHYNYDV
jgi:hypothetical protein